MEAQANQLTNKISNDLKSLLSIYDARDKEFLKKKSNFEEECKVKLANIAKIAEESRQRSENEAKKIIDKANVEAAVMRKEIKKWNEEKLLISRTEHFNTNIKLDVGGIHFTTSLATLQRFPESMIGAMFSGRHSLPKNEDGFFFIDRDGTHFRHILNFLRNPEEFSVDLSTAHLIELKKEAKYYLLEDEMFPFTKAEDKRVQTRSGKNAVVSQDDNGLWYAFIDHNHNPNYNHRIHSPYIPKHVEGPNKILLIICNSCTAATLTESNDCILKFLENREIFPGQPRFDKNSRCLNCGRF